MFEFSVKMVVRHILRGEKFMTFLTIIVVLIIGLAMLLIGFATEKRWLKILSILPLALSIWQLVSLILMDL
jgi:hypothetical protein